MKFGESFLISVEDLARFVSLVGMFSHRVYQEVSLVCREMIGLVML